MASAKRSEASLTKVEWAMIVGAFLLGVGSVVWGFSERLVLAPLLGFALIVVAIMGRGLAKLSLELGDFVFSARR